MRSGVDLLVGAVACGGGSEYWGKSRSGTRSAKEGRAAVELRKVDFRRACEPYIASCTCAAMRRAFCYVLSPVLWCTFTLALLRTFLLKATCAAFCKSSSTAAAFCSKRRAFCRSRFLCDAVGEDDRDAPSAAVGGGGGTSGILPWPGSSPFCSCCDEVDDCPAGRVSRVAPLLSRFARLERLALARAMMLRPFLPMMR